MIYFLIVSLFYLLVNSLILWLNKHDFTPLLSANDNDTPGSLPLISICIPARNEEAVIARAVRSALRQTYPNLEVLVLDDRSADATPEILARQKNKNPELLSVIPGKKKPAGWLGKSWACHQLSEQASGDQLIFIDADVWLEQEAVRRVSRSMNEHNIDFITVWPLQKLETFWEKVVIPIIYYGLLSLLPARYVYRDPRWLPDSYKKSSSIRFAAACGQCMAFKSEVYADIGGHGSVKDKIVEDVALAKQIKQNGYRMRMYHGEGTTHCRMYTSGSEMWQGFRKNFLALYNNSISVFTFMAVLNFVVFVLPFLLLPFVLWIGKLPAILLCIAAIVVIFIHRLILAQWYSFDIAAAFTHPLGVLWFHALGIRVLVDYVKGHAPEWKGRTT